MLMQQWGFAPHPTSFSESEKEKPKRLSLCASLRRKRFSYYVRNFAAQNRLC